MEWVLYVSQFVLSNEFLYQFGTKFIVLGFLLIGAAKMPLQALNLSAYVIKNAQSEINQIWRILYKGFGYKTDYFCDKCFEINASLIENYCPQIGNAASIFTKLSLRH